MRIYNFQQSIDEPKNREFLDVLSEHALYENEAIYYLNSYLQEHYRDKEPINDFYTIITLVLLNFSYLDSNRELCFYFDELICDTLEITFQCSKSCIKRYLSQLVERKLLQHFDGNRGKYYFEDTIKNCILCMPTILKLILSKSAYMEYINMHPKLNSFLKNANLTEREKYLFTGLSRFMLYYQEDEVFQLIIMGLDIELPQFTNGVKFLKPDKNNTITLKAKAKGKEPYNKKCFVFINPPIRHAIYKDKYGRSYFHEDLTQLHNKGVLIKASAYRYFLYLDFPHYPNKELKETIDGFREGMPTLSEWRREIAQKDLKTIIINELKREADNMLEQTQTEADTMQEQTQAEVNTTPEQARIVTDSEIDEFLSYQLPPELRQSSDVTPGVIQLNEEQESDEPPELPDTFEGLEEDAELAKLIAEAKAELFAEANESSDTEADTTPELDS